MIDLHFHSHFSDGALTPQGLINKARQVGLELVSLTDHDTIDGYLSLRPPVTDIMVIPGVELSVRWKKYDLHIIGLNFDVAHPALKEALIHQRNSRKARAEEIGRRLEQLGLKGAYEQACILAGSPQIGRPHFAQVLVNVGLAKDLQHAFTRFLGRGRMAYVPTPWLDLESAVTTIVKAGGQAVIAHPLKYGLTRTKLHELIRAFKTSGGSGIEVVSGAMTELQIETIGRLSLLFDLQASSGSDYHSDNISMVKLGCQSLLPEYCRPIWRQWM